MTHTVLEGVANGLKCRCPNCGKGKLFRSFLKVVDKCEVCDEEFHHHRADDLPAYFAILIVGHIIVSLATGVEIKYSPHYWVHLALWGPLTIIMTLAILQPIKGAAVAIQWRIGMHGFRHSKNSRDGNKND